MHKCFLKIKFATLYTMCFECKCGKSKIVTKKELYTKLTAEPKKPVTLVELAEAFALNLMRTW